MTNPDSDVNAIRRYDEEQPEETGWLGWVAFAGTMMILLGAFHVMAGFVALFTGPLPGR